jgi:hypothetical protein
MGKSMFNKDGSLNSYCKLMAFIHNVMARAMVYYKKEIERVGQLLISHGITVFDLIAAQMEMGQIYITKVTT